LNDILSQIPLTHDIVIAGDMNAQVGTRNTSLDDEGSDFDDVLGP